MEQQKDNSGKKNSEIQIELELVSTLKNMRVAQHQYLNIKQERLLLLNDPTEGKKGNLILWLDWCSLSTEQPIHAVTTTSLAAEKTQELSMLKGYLGWWHLKLSRILLYREYCQITIIFLLSPHPWPLKEKHFWLEGWVLTVKRCRTSVSFQTLWVRDYILTILLAFKFELHELGCKRNL